MAGGPTPYDALHARLAETVVRATEMDARRAQQISNQVDSINRLLAAGDQPSYEAEMAALHLELSKAQREYRLLVELLTGRLAHKDLAVLSGEEIEALIHEGHRIAELPDSPG